MSIRRYIVIRKDGAEGEEFEIDLPADAPDFTHHPVTHEPCRRVIVSPSLTVRYGEGAMKQATSDKKLRQAGFRKLEKDGNGGWTEIN
ncbi:MAG: FmdB family transcriptional regulator [bacterium]